jgi:hypothetical protein
MPCVSAVPAPTAIFGVLKAALNLAFREGHAATDEDWRRVKPFREASAPKIRT